MTNAPRSITQPLIGCVQHDCAKCKKSAKLEARLVELLLCVLAEDDKYGNLCGTTRADIEKELKEKGHGPQ